MAVLLTRRAVVQVGMEATYGVNPNLGLNDGILVSNPDYSVQPDVLKREIVTDTLSPQPGIMGRMLATMKFTTELRSNGTTNSGLATNAPHLSRMLRASGYALSASTTPTASAVYSIGSQPTLVTATTDASTATNTAVIQYRMTVVTGGASGVATMRVDSDVAGESSNAASVTSGTAITLGTKGLKVTATWTGNLYAGQTWIVWALPPGMALDPVSTNFESVTLYMNKDGVLHTLTGAFGTFQVRAEAGKFATIDWTFTGLYVAPQDVSMVKPNYTRTLPAMVELSRFSIDGFAAIAKTFTFDQKNEVNVREDLNSAQGFIGTRITARNPDGGVDPEADRVATYDFWGAMTSGKIMPFMLRVGRVPGNTVWFLAPSTQYSGLTYRDRNGILTYDAGIMFSRVNGDDECKWFFC